MLLSLFTNELKMATVIILEVPTMLVFEIHTHTLEASAFATDPICSKTSHKRLNNSSCRQATL